MLAYISGFILWLSLSIVAGIVARSKGRSVAGYFFLSIFLSPLVGLIAIALLPPIHKEAVGQAKPTLTVFLVPIGFAALLSILLWYGLSLDPHKIPSPLVGKPLPAFRLPALENPGKIVSNVDLRNRVVVINVWASWCVTCKQEHPVLMDLARRNIAPIIGLNYKDPRPDAIAVLKNEGNPYEVSLMDSDGRTGIDWGVYGVPETFILDKDGVIRYKHIGAITQADVEQKLLPLIKNLLL